MSILVTNNDGWPGVEETALRLARGEDGLDAIEAGIRLVESDERVRSVGRGGWPNLVGDVELDAAVMDGATLRTGAVGGIKGFLHPISIAREMSKKLPHELLIGEGAARFALEIGAERGENLTEDSSEAWKKWFAEEVPQETRGHWGTAPLWPLCHAAIDPEGETGRDTTVFIAMDQNGGLSGGVSTSGWGWKYPGRLGDSPVIGAGLYVDNRYGAAACTGTGEMTIRCSTARSVILYLKMGMNVHDAVEEAANDMRALSGGLIQRVNIHAIDTKGRHRVAGVNGVSGHEESRYWVWNEGDAKPRSAEVDFVPIHI